MGTITLSILSILFIIYCILVYKKIIYKQSKVDKLINYETPTFMKIIFGILYTAMFYMGVMVIGISVSLNPIKQKNQTIIKQDTTNIYTLPDQNYLMTENKNNILYFYNNKKSLLMWSNFSIKLESKNFICDTIKGIEIPYMVRYTVSTKDSTIQNLIFGWKKTFQYDTLFIPNKQILKEL